MQARCLLIGSLLLFLSCGYSTRSLLPSHLRTIGFEPVDNRTLEPELTEQFEARLREAFARDRTLRVVDLDQADVTLTAQLASYSKEAAAYTGDQRVTSYRLTSAASLTAMDKVRNELLYSGNVSAQMTFDPNAVSEESTASTLTAKLAAEAVRVLLLAW
jgi:outer membrane lipopolysaccharide assembly protein LptE/RlpB